MRVLSRVLSCDRVFAVIFCLITSSNRRSRSYCTILGRSLATLCILRLFMEAVLATVVE